MPIIQIPFTIPASGIAKVSNFLPARTGGTGNLLASSPAAPFSDSGSILLQNATIQNQGSHTMYAGGTSTTNTPGGGIYLGAQGSFTAIFAITFSTYVSDWFVAGTPGDIGILVGFS